LTANAVYGAKEELLQAGFDDYVAKPIDIKKLEEMLHKYLSMQDVVSYKNSEQKNTGIALEGIDSAAVMEQLNLSEEIYCGILKNYYRDLKAVLPRIRSQKASGDMKRFVVDVHSMKSTSASVGAMELSELAKQMEAAGKENDMEYIDSHMVELERCCEKILLVLSNFFEKESPRETALEQSVLEVQWLLQIRKACEDMDSSEAVTLLKQISGKRFSAEETELVQKIEEYIEQYDYDEVLTLLAEVKE